jgi:hypothetical protein
VKDSHETSMIFADPDKECILLVEDRQSLIVYLTTDSKDGCSTCGSNFFWVPVLALECLESIEDELLAIAVPANDIFVHCVAQLRWKLQKAKWLLVGPTVVSGVSSSRYWEGILMIGNRGIILCDCAVASDRAAVFHDAVGRIERSKGCGRT